MSSAVPLLHVEDNRFALESASAEEVKGGLFHTSELQAVFDSGAVTMIRYTCANKLCKKAACGGGTVLRPMPGPLALVDKGTPCPCDCRDKFGKVAVLHVGDMTRRSTAEPPKYKIVYH
jgi:hypothetical protein